MKIGAGCAKRSGQIRRGVAHLRWFAVYGALLGVVSIAHGSTQGVTIAPNPAAREDAFMRMNEQLRAALLPSGEHRWI